MARLPFRFGRAELKAPGNCNPDISDNLRIHEDRAKITVLPIHI